MRRRVARLGAVAALGLTAVLAGGGPAGAQEAPAVTTSEAATPAEATNGTTAAPSPTGADPAGDVSWARPAALEATAVTPDAVAAALPAADTKKCSDFLYQEDAQAFFDADPTDPSRLDQGGVPNVACEALPHRPAASQPTATTAAAKATTTTTRAPTASTGAKAPTATFAATGRNTPGEVCLGLGFVILGAAMLEAGKQRRHRDLGRPRS